MTAVTDTFSRAVAGTIRAELRRRQRTIGEAAAAIGVSRQYLSKLLNDGAPFDTDELARLARYLEMPVARIFESAALNAEEAS